MCVYTHTSITGELLDYHVIEILNDIQV